MFIDQQVVADDYPSQDRFVVRATRSALEEESTSTTRLGYQTALVWLNMTISCCPFVLDYYNERQEKK